MELKTNDYHIVYHQNIATIICKGSLLLNGTLEYAPLSQLLNKAAQEEQFQLTLDVRQLDFLNSLGINTMTKFVITVRNKQTLQLRVIGQGEVPWQVKLLKNFQRLMPELAMVLE